MSLSNDPGQYPGRPSPGDFMNPHLMPGAPNNQGGSQLTTEQREAQRHLNRLRLINFALFLPFIGSVAWYLLLTAEPQYKHRPADKILVGILVLLILASVIRNKIVKARLRHRHGII